MSNRVSLRAVCDRIDYGLTASAAGDGSVKFLRITDIENSFVDWRSVPFCSPTANELQRYRLQTGDVVVARTGASTGRSAWVHVDEPAVFASYLVRFRAAAAIDSRYLGYVLQSRHWRHYVNSLAHGKSAQPNLSAAAMANFEFHLPDLPQQRAIADVLGALDDKIAANARLAYTSDGLGRALIRRQLKENGRAVPLASIAAITMGSSPPGASYNETGVGTVFYQGIRDFGIRHPTNRVWTTAPVRVADPLDTLLSVRAPVGTVNLADEDTCIGRGLAALKSTQGRPYTLFHTLRVADGVWEPYESGGTVFGSINRKELADLALPTPSEEIANELEHDLRLIEQRLRSALHENEPLAATRDALLPALMSGKLRVRDAERVVSDVT